MWSLPGGMVDPGESVSTTLVRWRPIFLATNFYFVVREFMEEALDSIETGSKKVNSHTFKFKSFQVNQLRATVEDFFADGHELYRGYVQVGS